MRSSSSGEADLLYSLSLLKNKVNEVQSLLSILSSPITRVTDDHQISTLTSIVQEIIGTASSMMFTCQQMMTTATTDNSPPPSVFSETLDWYNPNQQGTIATTNPKRSEHQASVPPPLPRIGGDEGNHSKTSSTVINNDDIIELDVAEILAKYTHYCQICGKGFKRDANLRMHMRAHGDEYKTTIALTKTIDFDGVNKLMVNQKKKKYSCPQEGCRWNQRHAKFQPLKSMICAKNHYKRSHCPKMYVCKQCNRKHFSVLSDLRTHEKHCGHSNWQCSCGTTFSRKDKLMGHVALFVGHIPIFLNNNNLLSANDTAN